MINREHKKCKIKYVPGTKMIVDQESKSLFWKFSPIGTVRQKANCNISQVFYNVKMNIQ